MKKGIAVVGVLGVLATFGVLAFRPKKAHASESDPLNDTADDADPNAPVQPQNAQEVYALAMNPGLKDPDKVHEYALWLASSGQRPDWAAAAENRAVNLRAEQLLSRGLLSSTSLDEVEALARQLAAAPTHQPYAAVLASRIAVARGAAPPPPFMLTLLSGGELQIDLSIYSPSKMPAAPGVVTPPSPTSPVTPQPVPAVSPVTPTPSPSTPNGPVVPVVPAVPVVPTGPAKPPLAEEETRPENDPNGTIALARLLLDEQTRSQWKYISQAVKEWQVKMGLTPDGKFGPGSALRMAVEVAVLPWIRYWPTSFTTKTAAVNDYRGRLKALALSMTREHPERAEHAASLLRSAELETGQGWPAAPKAAPATPPSPVEIDAALKVLQSELRQQSLGKVAR